MSEHSAEDRQDNGLRAPAYVPLTDVEPEVGRVLLSALGRARIAAYLVSSGPHAPTDDRRRLFVASEERIDARTIVAAAVRALGAPEPDLPLPDDPLAGVDTDSAFKALIADWHVDTHAAIRQAERELRSEDEDWQARLNAPPVEDPIWLDDDHYVPPPPPPLPRLAPQTIIAMLIIALSILLLATEDGFGVAGNFSFVVGIGGLLLGGGILLSRVREYRQDDDDDGAAI